MTWRRAAAIVTAGALLAACSGGDGDDGASTDTNATSGAAATSGTSAAPVDPADKIEDEVLLGQVEWVLDQLDADKPKTTVEDVEKHFSAQALKELSAEELVKVLGEVRGSGPFTVTKVVTGESGQQAAALTLESSQRALLTTVSVDEDGKIEVLLFQPDTAGEPPSITNDEEMDAAFDELGGTTQVVVGDVKDGACTVTHTSEGVPDGGEPAPSGSVFKLLVLAAVADAVEAGDLAWDDELTITDEVKSLPSGTLQNEDAGSKVTVRDAAEGMISISDNTATDLLIDAVGQKALAAAAKEAGIDADQFLPVPTTRQLFQLGWQVDDGVRKDWADAKTEADRKKVLDGLPAKLDVEPKAVTTPVWKDGVDWMLTGQQVCTLHAQLQADAGEAYGKPVRDILTKNPGGEKPEGVDYQGFKGGSVPGVLATSYYLESDGAGKVLVVQTASDKPVDQMRAATITESVLAHVAQR